MLENTRVAVICVFPAVSYFDTKPTNTNTLTLLFLPSNAVKTKSSASSSKENKLANTMRPFQIQDKALLYALKSTMPQQGLSTEKKVQSEMNSPVNINVLHGDVSVIVFSSSGSKVYTELQVNINKDISSKIIQNMKLTKFLEILKPVKPELSKRSFILQKTLILLNPLTYFDVVKPVNLNLRVSLAVRNNIESQSFLNPPRLQTKSGGLNSLPTAAGLSPDLHGFLIKDCLHTSLYHTKILMHNRLEMKSTVNNTNTSRPFESDAMSHNAELSLELRNTLRPNNPLIFIPATRLAPIFTLVFVSQAFSSAACKVYWDDETIT